MRLKKIKLAGFKSFVDPTTIPFPAEMTAVVGPNGCGKSNVIDAVRWVLGESSAKNLRGDAMTDVIFNGSTARKPVSQCSVELTFDNSSGRIQGEYAGYNELSVKRIVTKDAQSSYLLNNTKCRRRDVTDLFLGTGLGPRSYAIIEQGMISRLIESKPQELRVFIEEAAGVSKYKERRRETETRIRHTKENLERLEDVRGELGQQLDKLQRQATAARRYKDLKQKERTLKGELAAIRWLKHSDKVAQLEKDIAQKNADIEAYVAQQRGEEKDITLYKEQQNECKQSLNHLQQQIFKVGTDISRIEQNQIHAKQRQQQISQETQELNVSIEEQLSHQAQATDKINELEQQIALAEPEKMLLEEQFEETEISLLEAEESFSGIQQYGRQHEQTFNQIKGQAQTCHGKIQSLMSMQLRTQSRISDVKDELGELADTETTLELASVTNAIQALSVEEAQHKAQVELAEKGQQLQRDMLKKAETDLLTLKGQVQSTQAKLDGLNILQNQSDPTDSIQQQLAQQHIPHEIWWQSLDVRSGWETAFETISQNWKNGLLVAGPNIGVDLCQYPNGVWLFSESYTSDIPDGCLAKQLNANKVPRWLTYIKTADSYEHAVAMLAGLESQQSIMCKNGIWLSREWMISGNNVEQGGQIKRAKQIQSMTIELNELTQNVNSAELSCATYEKYLSKQNQLVTDKKDKLHAVTRNLMQAINQSKLLEQQQQLNSGRQQKLNVELNTLLETLEDEKEQLETLSIQAEELEVQLESIQEEQLSHEDKKERAQLALNQRRAHLDSVKNKLHQLALHEQGVKSQYHSLQESLRRDEAHLTSLQQKLGLLKAEAEELSMPMEDQADTLQQLLEQKAELSIKQTEYTEKLAEVEEKLSVAEKGQQGVTDKIQGMLTELQSIKLECEGFRVRANGVLEQLQELEQNLKTILSTLDTAADEKVWQAELEKTQSSLSRLGAVNLAAVEEFEIQAERKQHLDDQNDDLVSALDILEQAIRKIDRETRTRFKETFEQVNSDLKMLFPKVFGGGSAYLDLTDEDLLETGVTIMARPPGKKNSTIHLLSGGEKALTALSLVFAIFRLNPAPFCLLDEVDAPLDDANVGRFCKLVSEMSKSVQFIYITHNKIAMEMATHLTGVTMAEPGVSRMVAVDVDEAVAIAQA